MLSAFIALLENENDRKKFAAIYHQYQRKMYAVAMHYLRDTALAEDAVQDSFVKIIQNFSKCRAIPCNEMECRIVYIMKSFTRTVGVIKNGCMAGKNEVR